MKKMIVTLALSAVMLTALPMTAYAHGHGSRSVAASAPAAVAYSLCTVEDCSTMGNHEHNGTTYAGHYAGDGHDYHQVCSVEDCTQTGSHDHNGTTCLPHNGSDGHSYHNGGSHQRGSCHSGVHH